MRVPIKKTIAREFLILISTCAIAGITFLGIYAYNSFFRYKIDAATKTINDKSFLVDSLSKLFKQKGEFLSMSKQDSDPLGILKGCILDINLSPFESAVDKDYSSKKQDIMILELYNAVHDAELYTKSLDDFKKKYSTTDKIDFLYTTINQAGLYCKSKIEFYKKFYPGLAQKIIDENIITSVDSLNFQKSISIQDEIKTITNYKHQYNKKILSSEEQITFSLKVFYISIIMLFGVRHLYYSIRWSIKTLKQKAE